MARSLFFQANCAIWTLLIGLIVVAAGPWDRRGRFVARCGRLWGRLILWSAGVPYRATGFSRLDSRGQYIFTCNHESALDIPLCFAGIPFPIVPIAKKELRKIPVLGQAMGAARFVFVDRSNHQAAMASLQDSARVLKTSGRSVLLYPEGTRSVSGEVGRFRKGGLSLADVLRVPIVPVAICGTRAVLPKGTLRLNRAAVELRIGAPIDPSEWERTSGAAFAEMIRERVVALKEEAEDHRAY